MRILRNFKHFTYLWWARVLFFFSVCFSISSCEDEAGLIGKELLHDGDVISTQFTDTLSINASTVLLDSIVTSGANHLLVGRYTDPVFGTVEAKSFFQIANIDTLRNPKDAILDSVVLSLGYKYYHGDTLKRQNISVHRVLEKIGQNTGNLTKRLLESLENRNTFYNTDALKYDPTPLGAITNFTPRPVKLRNKQNAEFDSLYNSLNIRLNPEFGYELLGLQGKRAGNGLVDFKEYLKGLVLVPGASDDASVLGFEPNNTPSTVALKPSYLGLYYHSKEKKDTLSTFFLVSFTTNEAFNNRFNHVSVNRSATALAAIQKVNQPLPAVGSNKEVYVQSSTGLSTRVEIPYIKNLAKNGNIALNKAELILEPVNLFPGALPVIALNMVNINPKDKTRPWRTPTGELFAIAGEGNIGPQTAIYNTKTKKYVFNVTSYIQNVMTGKTENNGFIISSGNDHRVNRTIFNKNTMKLKVYYSQLGK